MAFGAARPSFREQSGNFGESLVIPCCDRTNWEMHLISESSMTEEVDQKHLALASVFFPLLSLFLSSHHSCDTKWFNSNPQWLRMLSRSSFSQLALPSVTYDLWHLAPAATPLLTPLLTSTAEYECKQQSPENEGSGLSLAAGLLAGLGWSFPSWRDDLSCFPNPAHPVA